MFHMTPGTLLVRTRNKRINQLQMLTYYALRDRGASWPEIGELVGREHTNVLRACRTPIEKRIAAIVDGTSTPELMAVKIRGIIAGAGELKPADPEKLDDVLTGRADTGDFHQTKEFLARVPRKKQKAVWKVFCLREYPHTWRHQCRVLPRGVDHASTVC